MGIEDKMVEIEGTAADTTNENENKNNEDEITPSEENLDKLLLQFKHISLATKELHSKTIPLSNEEIKQLKHYQRTKIWQLMTDRKLVKDYPPSCFDKIPNFKGCGAAAERLSNLREFRHAQCVKVNPSLAQMHLRFLTLKRGKTLLVPSPSLSEALMYRVEPSSLKKFWQLKRASSKAGAKELGTEIGLDAIDNNKQQQVDLYVVASTVCSVNGVRLGKGLGYAELEWGILYTLGLVNRDTVVATTVHDCQVLSRNELPTSLMCRHDLPVDVIVTPTRIINVREKLDKPDAGICWDLITKQQFESIPILKKLQKVC